MNMKDSKQSAGEQSQKHYNLALSATLFDELKQTADSRGTTVIDLLRRFIKLGMIALEIEKKPGAALIIRDGDTERQLILV